MRTAIVPYRDFPVEYPPGALPTFIVPTLIGGTYATTFAWTMAFCGVALVVVARVDPARRGALRRARAGARRLAHPLALRPVADAARDASRVGALLAGRHRLGWAFLGAAVAAKIWPFVLVPPALVWSIRRGRLRASLAGSPCSPSRSCRSLVLAPHGLWASLSGQASRPLQIESLGAAFFTFLGHPLIVNSHGSQNVERRTAASPR